MAFDPPPILTLTIAIAAGALALTTRYMFIQLRQGLSTRSAW
ncbi:hypothetical protein ACT3R7_06335 [Halomonas sp. AOP43-A1-21]|nr:hypothetical protein [Halomonas colorata]